VVEAVDALLQLQVYLGDQEEVDTVLEEQVVQVMQEVLIHLKEMQEVKVILMQTKTTTEVVVEEEPLQLEVVEQVQVTQGQELLEMVVMVLM
tara:strand:+ start:40 stop:315 length:276 start_codon:yes stop_codon:yes gene_type:complete